MKIQIPRANLVKALNIARDFAATEHVANEWLKFISLKAQSDKLSLSAFNGVRACLVEIGCDVQDEGDFILDPQTLSQLCNTVEEETLTLEDTGTQIQVATDTVTIRLNKRGKDHILSPPYESLQLEGAAFNVSNELFMQGVSRTAFAVDVDSHIETFASIELSTDRQGGFRAVALDNYKLAYFSTFETDDRDSYIISLRNLKPVMKFFRAYKADFNIKSDTRYVIMYGYSEDENMSFCAAIPKVEEFAPYEKLLRVQQERPYRFKASRKEFTKMTKQLKALGDGGEDEYGKLHDVYTQLQCLDDEISASFSVNQAGQGKTSVNAEVQGEFTIALDGFKMNEVMQKIPTEGFRFEWPGYDKFPNGAFFLPEGELDYDIIYMISPMGLREE